MSTSRPETPPMHGAAPYPSCVVQPRAALFDAGVVGVDLLRLGGSPPPPAAAASAPVPAVTAAPTPGPLSSHPLHALTASRPTVAAPPPPPILPPPLLGPLHAALRHDLTAATATAAGSARSGLTLSSWVRRAGEFLGASPALARLYWSTFLAVHRASCTPSPPAPVPAAGSGAGAGAAGSQQVTECIRPPTLRLEVDLQEFMLFLFAQRYLRHRDRNQPVQAAASLFSPAPLEAAQRSFLLEHLPALLTWCKDGDREREWDQRERDSLAALPSPAASHSPSPSASAGAGAYPPGLALTAAQFDRMAILLQGVPHPQDPREAVSLAALTPFFAAADPPPAATAAAAAAGGAASAALLRAVSVETLGGWLATQLNRPALSLSLSCSFSSEDVNALLSLSTAAAAAATPAALMGRPRLWLPLLGCTEVRQLRDCNLFLRRPRAGEAEPSAAVAAFMPIGPALLPSPSALSARGSVSGSGSGGIVAGAVLERTILPGGLLRLWDCARLSLYATDTHTHRFVSASRLSQCVLHLGVVTHLLRLEHCHHCVVHVVLAHGACAGAAAGGEGVGVGPAVQLSHCRDVKLYIHSGGAVHLLQGRRPATAASPPNASTASAGAGAGAGAAPARKDRPAFTLADLTLSDSGGAPAGADADAIPGAEGEEPNNCGIVLAPFAAPYPALEGDLRAAGWPGPATAAAAAADKDGREGWGRFEVVESVDVVRCAAAAASAASIAAAQAQAQRSPVGGGGAATAVVVTSVAAGGRKSKTAAQALQGGGALAISVAAAGASVVPPLLQSFPGLAASPLSPPSPSPSPSQQQGQQSASAAAACSEVMSHLPPAQFFPATVPAPPSSYAVASAPPCCVPPANPFPLPSAYASALQARQAQALRNRLLIDRAGLTAPQRALLQERMQSDFALWLSFQYPAGVLNNALGVDRQRAAAEAQARLAAAAAATGPSFTPAAAPSSAVTVVATPAKAVPFQPAVTVATAAAAITAPVTAAGNTQQLSAAAQLQQALLLQEQAAHAGNNGISARPAAVLQGR